MPDPPNKDNEATLPAELGERTTPYATPGDPEATQEFDLTASTLGALRQRYDLLAELGRGGMGVVFKARDRETGDVVALKVLQPEIASRPGLIERFKSELVLARKVTHKNVCRVYDLNRFGAVAAISMEYVEGESLRAALKREQGVSVPYGLSILRQVIAGLAEAHAQGVVHRDLKPENIVIARDGTVKVMDFGIARSLDADATQTGTGMLVGTPAYMSPEQAEGKPVDARTDIYSLGLVMFEMLTGQRAFQADTPMGLAIKQIQEAPPAPLDVNPYLPVFLDRAIRKCLEKQPKKRFQAAEELASAMKPAADVAPGPEPGAPAETEPIALPAEAVQWQRRDSWLLAGGMLAAVVFFALFSRVYPYSSLRLHIGEEGAVEKAVALVQKFEPTATDGRTKPFWLWWLATATAVERPPVVSFPEIQQAIMLIRKHQSGSRWWQKEYPLKVKVLGLPEANRQLAYDDYWEVRVDLGPSRAPAWVSLRTDGSVHSLRLPAPPRKDALPPPSAEQASRDGATYARQVFETDLSNLEPKVQHLGEVTTVAWELPGPIPALKRVVSVRLAQAGWTQIQEDFLSRQASEESSLSGWIASEEVQRLMLAAPGRLVFLLMLLLMIGLFFARRLYQKVVRSASLAALCMVLAFGGIWFQDHEASGFSWLVASAAAMAIFLVNLFLFATAEDYLGRRLRSRVVTWFLLVRRPGEARAAGLSILRGCVLGLIFLAGHTLMVYAIGWIKLAGPSTVWLETAALSGRPYLALYALSYAVLATIPRVWCVFGFPAALAAGIRHRPAVLVGVPAALCVLAFLYLPGTTPTTAWVGVFFAVFQGLVFSLIFYRYDLLTLACAIFTMATWLLIYPVYTIFSAIQPLQPMLAMMPWFLLLLGGTLIYLRPQLAAARRHIAAVFE